MSGNIENSRAIVTGGAQGIGFQLCRHLLIKGAKVVVIFDVDESAGIKSIKKLNDEFGQSRSSFLMTDVTNATQFEKNFKKIVQELGGVEILINNAGIMDYSRWSLMIDLNFKSVVHGTLLGINYMGKHKGGKGGTIINTGSTASFFDKSCIPIYAATKAAVCSFSRHIGQYHDKTGVAVKVICPGRVETNLLSDKPHQFLDFLVDPAEAYERMIRKPALKPEDIAPEVMRLIEDSSNNAAWVKMTDVPTSIIKFTSLPENLIPLDSKDK